MQRFDRPGDFYYLTPWQLSGKVVALIDVDARFGVFKSIRVPPAPSQDWAIPHTRRLAMSIFSSTKTVSTGNCPTFISNIRAA